MAAGRKSRAIGRLQKVLDAIPELEANPGRTGSGEFKKWRRDTEVAISYTFRDESRHLADFKGIRFMPGGWVLNSPNPIDYRRPYLRGLKSASSVLQSMIDEVKEYWGDDDSSDSDTRVEELTPTVSSKVFIVHGKDDGAKQTVARFLERLELSPIILHEQPNQGQTIIEKFEEYSDVGFAIVLLTPDDVGGPADGSDVQRARARQNVILELGFFLGKLGRERTCALLVDDVEIPSDYDGVLYIPMDGQGAWMMNLVRELKGAGLEVDANLAL